MPAEKGGEMPRQLLPARRHASRSQNPWCAGREEGREPMPPAPPNHQITKITESLIRIRIHLTTHTPGEPGGVGLTGDEHEAIAEFQAPRVGRRDGRRNRKRRRRPIEGRPLIGSCRTRSRAMGHEVLRVGNHDLGCAGIDALSELGHQLIDERLIVVRCRLAVSSGASIGGGVQLGE